jgi:hypothetical protein
MNNVAETGSDIMQNLGDAVRKNPVSAALIGMGVLWLVSGGKSAPRAGEFVRKGMNLFPEAATDGFLDGRHEQRSGGYAR